MTDFNLDEWIAKKKAEIALEHGKSFEEVVVDTVKQALKSDDREERDLAIAIIHAQYPSKN